MVVKEGFVGSDDASFLGGSHWAHPAETTQRLLPGRRALTAFSSPLGDQPLAKALGAPGSLQGAERHGPQRSGDLREGRRGEP